MLKLSRDEWMVISRALQDRPEALRRAHRPMGMQELCQREAEECKRLQRLVDDHVDATWQPPKASTAAA